MTTGMMRTPTWHERENNKRRERRRRAIAGKIYTGLRMYGNYKLPKHCDNNEVLKALAREAGWVVEDDGTTYRKGCKPSVEPMDIMGGSASVSPCSSYPVSPRAGASYNPSPSSSSIPSPVRSYYAPNLNGPTTANSLIPWLKNLSSSNSSSTTSPNLPYIYVPGGSISAPVTPPLSSPTCRTPRAHHWAPPGPAQGVPTSPTFSLVSPNPFGSRDEVVVRGGGSRMWAPTQSGACSPVVRAGCERRADVSMSDGIAAEFAFGSGTSGLVKAWEGERVHEECVPDDLELTLGSSKTR